MFLEFDFDGDINKLISNKKNFVISLEDINIPIENVFYDGGYLISVFLPGQRRLPIDLSNYFNRFENGYFVKMKIKII